MTTIDTLAQNRATLTFSLHSLPAREEFIFKSIVRLLSHKSHQLWLYCPYYGGVRADLLVVAEGSIPRTSASDHGALQQVLTLGASGRSRDFYLRLPLRADELEAELNRLGDLIQASITASSQTAAPAQPQELDIAFRLLRWPPVALLATRERMRLATLMTGRAVTVSSLQKLSGAGLQTCSDFVDELRRAGLMQDLASQSTRGGDLAIPSASKPAAARAAGQSGLLARIRQRLGIQLFGGT